MSGLFDKLIRRGLIAQIYPESLEYRKRLTQLLADGQPTTVYTGFDATSKSLHVGHLATIVNSLYFHSRGHQVICVIGDATAQIGDPSGRSKDRNQIERSVIVENAANIESIIKRTFSNFQENFLVGSTLNSTQECPKAGNLSIEPMKCASQLKPPIIIRNSDWYKGENVIDFVDTIFRRVRVGSLLHKKSIQERLKTSEGMNMAEFSYQIFQAFDWFLLRSRYDCKLQIGGNDQQGNIYTGHDLIKKLLGYTDSIGLLAPLILNSRGKKLGKTTEKSNSAIWLDSTLTSPYHLYQYFHRTPDNDVERLLRVFSFYSDEYIDDIVTNRLRDRSDIWYCQRKLAEHACILVHGLGGLNEAKRVTASLYPNHVKVDG